MDEQFYCLHLDDYSAAAFTSFGKAYYGTIWVMPTLLRTVADHSLLWMKWTRY